MKAGFPNFAIVLCCILALTHNSCSKQIAQIEFVVSQPFDGELTIVNQVGSQNPKLVNGRLTIEIDPAKNNRFDYLRWPTTNYQIWAKLSNNDPIATELGDGKYQLLITGWTSNNDIIVKMKRWK